MKKEDNIFQVCRKCRLHVVKLHCDKKFESAVDEWRVKKKPIAKVNYCNARENALRVERKNRVVQEQAKASCYQMTCKHLIKELLRTMIVEARRK